MKRILLFAAAALAACAAQAQTGVAVQLDYGQTPVDVTVTPRTGKAISIVADPKTKVTILEYVQMHGGSHVDGGSIPADRPGSAEFRVKATTLTTDPSTAGAFRTVCGKPVKYRFDDSLVYPGRPGAAHLHPFYGNDGSDAFSTTASLETTGGGGCFGGIANRTSYWHPALIDSGDASVYEVDHMIVYYKNGVFTMLEGYGWKGPDGVWHEVIITGPDGRPMRKFPGFTTLPAGLAIIAGNPSRSTPRTSSETFDFRWTCLPPAGQAGSVQQSAFPSLCPVGGVVVGESFYPQCWDGKNLDSPDHKSHMAYPVNVRNAGDSRGWSHPECPATHPVVVPHITINAKWLVKDAAQMKRLRLVSDSYDPAQPAGYSWHSDWRNGWDRQIIETWTQKCIREMRDCHSDLLGDGRTLY